MIIALRLGVYQLLCVQQTRNIIRLVDYDTMAMISHNGI